MRTAMLTVVVLVAMGAACPAISKGPQVTGYPGYEKAEQRWTNAEDPRQARNNCRYRIEQARASKGQSKPDREPALPDKPIFQYAVDRTLDGCGVIVPVSDPTDMQPLPEPGRPALRPANPND